MRYSFTRSKLEITQSLEWFIYSNSIKSERISIYMTEITMNGNSTPNDPDDHFIDAENSPEINFLISDCFE